MDMVTQVQIPDEAVCFSLCTNALSKRHESIFSPLQWKINRVDSALYTWYGNQSREGKTEFKPDVLHLKISCITSCL